MPDLLQDTEWRGGARANVLVEASEWGARQTIEGILRGAGYATLACAGPEGAGQRCALVTEQGCAPAEHADVVVHALRHSDPRNLEALRALRRLQPATPVVVEAPAAVVQQRADDLEGCVVVEAPLTSTRLLDAVAQALATTDG